MANDRKSPSDALMPAAAKLGIEVDRVDLRTGEEDTTQKAEAARKEHDDK